jgi:hypothetical protein
MTNMPFGKFKGIPIEVLPDAYLHWLSGLEDLREPLRSAIYCEWRKRFDDEDYSRADAFTSGEATLLRQILEAGYRTLSLRMHPDCGGSHESMLRLNQLMNKLRSRGLLVV